MPMPKLILASKSPRRKELLKKAGYVFEVIPSAFQETFDPLRTPVENATHLSVQKALEVAEKADGIILSADTIAVVHGQLLGKPRDRNDAERMLKLLSGQTHEAITGFTVYDTRTKKIITKGITTTIKFRVIDQQEIDDYLDTAEPYDKAGAYALQAEGDKFVDKIDGSFSNIIGLPIEEISEALAAFGVKKL